ncbi:J domain-containing protein [Cupriavidus taiwanensis]|uniref:J domain-containing protein n=1 Tax=Cupriavidus taiwanensis TaxID=164546 RepID=UPI002541D46F|nr:J domain-containing protein [Cupriavidus taiwanensis]MDK3025456.1 J domain-containing protein [Cupriavidus taiwanensis]
MTRPVSTYYDTLQVAKSASDGVIRAAYRSLSQRYHPDKHPDKLQWANQMMVRLNEAYGVLSDPSRRAAYDRRLAEHEATRQSESVRQERRTTKGQSIPTLTPEQAAEWAEKQRAERERRLREEAMERTRREEAAERERAALAHRQRARDVTREPVQSPPAYMQKSTRPEYPIGWKTLVASMILGGYLGSSIGIVGLGGGVSGMVPGVIAGFFLWRWLKSKFGGDFAAATHTPSDALRRAAKSLRQGILWLLRWASIAAIVVFIWNTAMEYDRYATGKQQAASVAPPVPSPAYQAPAYPAPPPVPPQPAPVETQAQYDATVSRLEQRYSAMDPDSIMYNQRKVDIVLSLAKEYVRAGMSPSKALERAAEESLNPYSRRDR